MKILALGLSVALICGGVALAQETTDEFSVISGVGGHPCGAAPELREQYPGFEYVLGEWLAGYMSARGTIWRVAEEKEALNLRVKGLEPPGLAIQLFLRCEEEEPDVLISVVAEKVFADIVQENGQRYLGLAKK